MSGTTCIVSRGLQYVARCDFCGKAAEYVWLLFESANGKNHICNECVQEMMEMVYCVADVDEKVAGE